MATYDELMNNIRLRRLGMDVAADPLAYTAPRDPQTGEDLGWMNQDERERFYRHQEQFPEGEDMGLSLIHI